MFEKSLLYVVIAWARRQANGIETVGFRIARLVVWVPGAILMHLNHCSRPWNYIMIFMFICSYLKLNLCTEFSCL